MRMVRDAAALVPVKPLSVCTFAVGKWLVRAVGVDPPSSCTCPDWRFRGTVSGKLCKHMVRYIEWSGLILP